MANHQELGNFIWQIADLLRGPYRPPQYERVMLPMTVLRRFDCVLAPTKDAVMAEHEKRKGQFEGDALDALLNRVSGERFHNHSGLDFAKLKGDPDRILDHLTAYIRGFSSNVQLIFERFDYFTEIQRMHDANILYLVVSKFVDLDLHPDRVDNIEMGLLFEDLIRRFNEQANETAGDHFTPREVIRLMVSILFSHDDAVLSKPGTIRTILDPTCGTGGMLAEAQKYLREHHKEATLYVHGQDFNPRSYAMAASDLLIKGHEQSAIKFGDTLVSDQFPEGRFDYFLANPPFGVDWKKQQKDVTREHEKSGMAGRFGAGLPRVNDGSLLFLQHMISKFRSAEEGGSRLAVVFSGSPLFSGGAGSGESEIRKWIIENDWLEAILALPEQMFYNTGIGTYVWILSNRKSESRKGKIQLLDARQQYIQMRRSMGDKRRKIGEGMDMEPNQIAEIVRWYGQLENTETSKVFDSKAFGYLRVTVERPLRLAFQMTLDRKADYLQSFPHLLDDLQRLDKALGRERYSNWNTLWRWVGLNLKLNHSKWRAPETKAFRDLFTDRDPLAAPVISEQVVRRGKPNQDALEGWYPYPEDEESEDLPPQVGFSLFPEIDPNTWVRYEADSELRDFENIPLTDEPKAYFRREVLPHVGDAWMERKKDKVGYEINFNRHFYKFTPPRPLAVIDAELKAAEEEILRLLREVTE